MPQAKTWVLVADAHRARLFERDPKDHSLAPALDQEWIAETRPSREIASDWPGRSFDSGGEGRHAMEPSSDPARHAQESFAKDVVAILDKARTQQAFGDLILIAPPAFLGDLREQMSKPLQDVVSSEFAKDLSKQPAHELKSHLAKLLGKEA